MAPDPKAARAGYAQRKGTQPTQSRDDQLWAQVRTAYGRVENLGAALADTKAELDGAKAKLQVREPLTYQPGGPASWFADTFRAKRSNDADARKRLDAHEQQMRALAPKRAAARGRAAAVAAERALSAGPAEARALEAFLGAGHVIFERRAITRVDGSAGYTVPPAWLTDRTVPPARADSALLAEVTQLPLPAQCDSVNLPVLKTGTAAGFQQGDVTPPAMRDLADAFVTATVATAAGIADASMQWLDQSTPGANLDELIWDDLQASLQLSLDGALIAGSGNNSQPLGLFPPQTTVGTGLAVYNPNANTGTGQTLYYNGGTGTTLATTIAQAVSGVTRARAKRPTHLLTHPWVWDLITAMADQESRPYVPPKGPHPVPDDAQVPPGVVGHALGHPVLGDLNVPATFGGSYSPPARPYLGRQDTGQYAITPGTGAAALYTPVVPIVADDLFVFSSEPRMQILSDVTSGNLVYRFQLRQYVAVFVNRYQALTSGSIGASGGWTAGANSSYGVVTQEGSNSLLSITGQGF